MPQRTLSVALGWLERNIAAGSPEVIPVGSPFPLEADRDRQREFPYSEDWSTDLSKQNSG